MEEIFDQIRGTISCKLYYSALFMTVAIPDICSSLQSENNDSNSKKYKNWFNTYMSRRDPLKYGNKAKFTAEHLWNIRCSLFHSGKTNAQTDYKRLLFIEPGTAAYNGLKSIHCCAVGFGSPEQSLLVDIVRFCEDMIKGAEEWQKEKASDNNYKTNSDRLIKRYPNGIEPLISIPVIG